MTKKEEKKVYPKLELVGKYFSAKKAAVLLEAKDSKGSKKALDDLVKTIDVGEDGKSLVQTLQKMGDDGNAILVQNYAQQYEQARQGIKTGDLLEHVYGEQLKEIIGETRYEVATNYFGEYADTSYGDLNEKIASTKAKAKNLQGQGKDEDAKKLVGKIKAMEKVVVVVEHLETLRILDPTKQVKAELTAMFEPEKKAEEKKVA